MANIIYVEHDGTEHRREVSPGLSLMEGAKRTNVPGIDADCGGTCSCATCHVYVDDVWLARLDPPSPMESDMLAFAVGAAANSRLSCQVKVTEALDGLVLCIPASQR